MLPKTRSCSEDPDVKGTETQYSDAKKRRVGQGCSEDPDVKGTETAKRNGLVEENQEVAARIPM